MTILKGQAELDQYCLTKKQIAVVCKISDVTISKIFKLLIPFKEKIMSKD